MLAELPTYQQTRGPYGSIAPELGPPRTITHPATRVPTKRHAYYPLRASDHPTSRDVIHKMAIPLSAAKVRVRGGGPSDSVQPWPSAEGSIATDLTSISWRAALMLASVPEALEVLLMIRDLAAPHVSSLELQSRATGVDQVRVLLLLADHGLIVREEDLVSTSPLGAHTVDCLRLMAKARTA